jgi:sensor domain CHASE-containing protein
MNVTTAETTAHRSRPSTALERRPALPMLLALVVSALAGVVAWVLARFSAISDQSIVIATIVVASLIGWAASDRRR